ncbi:hypothetical protein pb186bvf_008332 [Paramecium bursaria]
MSQSPEQNLDKRVRRQRQHQNEDSKQESDQFWNNNPLFKEDSNQEEEGSYNPESISSSPQSQEQVEIQDSLNDWKDISESVLQNLQNQTQVRVDTNVSLFRQNLQLYTTQRGVHSYTDLSQLQRVDETSYVHFPDDPYTYKNSENLNRFYIGLPFKDKSGRDEWAFTKTQYHSHLFQLEDERYLIDREIYQLKYLIKKIQRIKLGDFFAYRNLVNNNSSLDLVSAFEDQILALQSRRKKLQLASETEAILFELSIDQQFYLQYQDYIQKYEPKSIQEQSLQRYQKLVNNELDDAYTIYPSRKLDQYTNIQLDNEIIPPLHILSFQNEAALGIIGYLILISLYYDRSKDLFLDLFNSLFQLQPFQLDINVGKVRPSTIRNFNWEKIIIEIQDDTTNIDLNQFKGQEDYQAKDYFPSYLNAQILLSRPILAYFLILMNKLYLSIVKILQLENIIQFSDQKQLVLRDIIISQILTNIIDFNSKAPFQYLCKKLFSEDLALEFSAFNNLLNFTSKLFGQFDQYTIQFLKNYIQSAIGDKARSDLQDCNSEVELQLPQCHLIRVAARDRFVIVHQFDTGK